MMTSESLAQAIERVGNPVELLRNQNWPAFTFPVAPEFTNWRDEQRAWATSVALMDQSHRIRATVAPAPFHDYARSVYRGIA